MKYFAILTIVVLLGCGFFATSQLFASAYATVANRSSQPSETALNASRLATRLAPGKVEYLHTRAYLEESLSGSAPALETYHQSLAANPSWPNTWAAIARHHARYNNFDDKMLTAVVRSQALGPYERTLQYINATVGVDYWYQLSPALREALQPSIMFSLSHEAAKPLLAYINTQGRTRLFCRRFTAAVPGSAKWCESARLPTAPRQTTRPSN